ncbi:glycosyl hydrolase family 43 [Mucilaginibacter hurinus]|uniref:Glycosyl hydrolase family 43 n=1 Tax=Mucilaginibacter hurinus TaxID=2201324 RepID=A0A367GRL0_9SPHI|nr:glycoside hydrolase family 43 protein [Mucilaginibacter hurinus]RCH55353.1 glycosyl hydrolase family 43 [Mucilaginibacter hurinus]
MKIKYRYLWVLLLVTGCSKSSRVPSGDSGNSIDPAYSKTMVANPIVEDSYGPSVAQSDGKVYFMDTKAGRIVLYQGTGVSYLRFAFKRTVYIPANNQENSNNIRPSELKNIDGKWYIYYSADNGFEKNHRMFVLENSSANPLEGTWESKKISGVEEVFADGPKVLDHNGLRYLIWSGWENADSSNKGKQQLYISKMTNPYTVEPGRIMISSPVNDWEKYVYQTVVDSTSITNIEAKNESPAILKSSSGRVFVSFSASSCSSDSYCIGLLSLKAEGNPLNITDWVKTPDPVFKTTPASNIYGPGRNSFFKSKDGTEDWMVYDANLVPNAMCTDSRNVCIQKIKWRDNGTPDFGEPYVSKVPFLKPSGE